MLSCKDVSRLLSQREDRKLGFSERVALRLHLLICDVCRNISRQMRFLRPAVQRLSRDDDRQS
jgi:hypothetical protein